MSLSVRQRGRALATFRGVEILLMEMLARWVPTTPEMEAKVFFGQQIWDHAQHADLLGRRVHELRLPLHHTLEPADGYAGLLREAGALAETPRRIHAYRGVLLPGLQRRYRGYLDSTDSLLDAPSVRVLTGILADMGRASAEGGRLLEEMPALGLAGEGASAWAKDLSAREAATEDLVRPGTGEAAAGGAS